MGLSPSLWLERASFQSPTVPLQLSRICPRRDERRGSRERLLMIRVRLVWLAVIESCTQIGHCRGIIPAQLAAQSVSSLCRGSESGIKIIVSTGALLPVIDPPRSVPEAELFLLTKKIPTGCDTENCISYWRSSPTLPRRQQSARPKAPPVENQLNGDKREPYLLAI
jgi:hypothetical protein